MQFIKRIRKFIKGCTIKKCKRYITIGTVLATIGIGLTVYFHYSGKLELREQTASIIGSLETIENPLINCNDLAGDWFNNDLALEINKEIQTIKLKERKKSGLLYFEQVIIPSFIVRTEVKPTFKISPNFVYFFEPQETNEGTFKVIIGDGEPDIVRLKYFIDGEWITAKEKYEHSRLPQPIASDENLTVRIETSPDDGYRAVKIRLIYKPGNNPNADKQVDYFNYTFPIKKHTPKINFAVGLVNPKLLDEQFTTQILICLIQEMKL